MIGDNKCVKCYKKLTMHGDGWISEGKTYCGRCYALKRHVEKILATLKPYRITNNAGKSITS